MRSRRVRVLRQLGIAALVITVPIPLMACSNAEATGNALGSELRAATGADVFSEPTVQRYSVESMTLTRPDPETLSALGVLQVRSTGSLHLSDGVITEAELTVTSGAAHQSVSFTLTEPLVLRRDESMGEPLDGTGLLEVGSVQYHNTHITMIPHFAEDGEATLDVEFDVPGGVFTPGDGEELALPGVSDTLVATMTLAAN